MGKGARKEATGADDYAEQLKSLKAPKLKGGTDTTGDSIIPVEDALDAPPDSGNASGSGNPAPPDLASSSPAPAPSAAAPTVPASRRLRSKTTPPTGAPSPATPPVVTPGTDLAPAVDKRLVKQKTPLFNMRQIVEQLAAATAADVPKLLLALHWRFWHAPEARLLGLLQAAGCPISVLKLLPEALKRCTRCSQFKLPPHRPMIKTTMARYFNHMMQADGYTLFGEEWLLMIDECFRYKQSDSLPSHSFENYNDAFMTSWFRWFGPPSIITVDQHGTFAGTQFGIMCDKHRIQRRLGGSDPSTAGGRGGKHTATSLAERHIALVKSTALTSCRLR